jgi:UDP-N-acetylmuramate--alanine ligase
MKIKEVKHIYFLGIGGIGMSALARYFLKAGKMISGYDKTSTVLTKTLESEGMEIHYEENVSLIPDSIDMVIFTPAIPKDNAEYVHLINSMPIYKRSEVLGMISKEKKTIAVAGTHGKTTTCSIVSYLLKNSGIDISAFVGGIMKNFNSNYLYGDSDWVVAEADEYDRSFLRLYPDIAVILSMDADHLDIYGDKKSVHQGFKDFTLNIKQGGSLWVHTSIRNNIDEEWKRALMDNGVSIQTFGINEGDLHATDVRVENGRFHYSLKVDNAIDGFALALGGRHNVSNAVVATAVSKELGCTWEDLKQSIESFKGIKRRFELVAEKDDAVLIDDYAHHPTELKAAINATRELYPNKKLTVVFQPHLFTRTRDFVDGFAKELSKPDTLILTEIYPARELPIEGVTSNIIFEKVTLEDKQLIHQSELIDTLKNKPFEILLITGAGDIDKKVIEIKEKYFNA